jgi:hypothetical protein
MCVQITLDAMRTGVQRLYAALPDIHVDLPPAYTLAERWIGLLAAAPPLIDAATVRALPKGYVRVNTTFTSRL